MTLKLGDKVKIVKSNTDFSGLVGTITNIGTCVGPYKVVVNDEENGWSIYKEEDLVLVETTADDNNLKVFKDTKSKIHVIVLKSKDDCKVVSRLLNAQGYKWVTNEKYTAKEIHRTATFGGNYTDNDEIWLCFNKGYILAECIFNDFEYEDLNPSKIQIVKVNIS